MPLQDVRDGTAAQTESRNEIAQAESRNEIAQTESRNEIAQAESRSDARRKNNAIGEGARLLNMLRQKMLVQNLVQKI